MKPHPFYLLELENRLNNRWCWGPLLVVVAVSLIVGMVMWGLMWIIPN